MLICPECSFNAEAWAVPMAHWCALLRCDRPQAVVVLCFRPLVLQRNTYLKRKSISEITASLGLCENKAAVTHCAMCVPRNGPL